MTHIYLRHENAAGSGDGIELHPGKSYFLPNEAPNTQMVDVVEELDANHSVTKLGIYERDVLVSVYGPGGIEVLEGGGGGRYKIPLSVDGQRQILIVLRRDDQILTQSGRWSLMWRTGESQMSVPAQAIQSDEVRSFDASLEISDSQSQGEVSSIPQEAAGNFVIAREDTEYGPPALASVLMPPPPLPRVDIVLDIQEEDSREETASEVDEEEYETNDQVKETVAVTSNARQLSQGTRPALSELSTNSVIILRTKASGSSLPPPLIHGAPQRDRNGNLQYHEGPTRALKEAIDDINDRQISDTTKPDKTEAIVSDAGKAEVEHLTNISEADFEEGRTSRFHEGSTVAVNTHVSDFNEGPHTDTLVAVQEYSLQTRTDLSPVADTILDCKEGPTSGESRTHVVEADRATNSERVSVSPEELEMTQTKLQIMALPTDVPPCSSASTRKRKATTSPRNESLSSKRSKVSVEELHLTREDDHEHSITVQAVPIRKKTTPSNGELSPSPRRTARTLKPSMKSLPLVSSSSSNPKRDRRKSRGVAQNSTPNRSRSTSAASSNHFDQYLGSPPKVLFASSATVDRKQATMKDFTKMGGEVVTKIDQANILIVGGDELKKTAKLIIAVARGIDVVNERWIIESRRKECLLDIIPFVPEDNVHETQWSFKLVDAISRGKEGVVQHLLHDTTVYMTKDLDKFPAARDLPSIVKVLGGNIVKSSLPHGKTRTKNVLIVGTQDDSQADEVERLGHKLYDKDVIILGALRGQIDTKSPEFQISVHVKEEEVD